MYGFDQSWLWGILCSPIPRGWELGDVRLRKVKVTSRLIDEASEGRWVRGKPDFHDGGKEVIMGPRGLKTQMVEFLSFDSWASCARPSTQHLLFGSSRCTCEILSS